VIGFLFAHAMDIDYDVFNYDKSPFYSLLESEKFKFKLEFVQQHQGLIICPLECKIKANDTKHQADLIERHLFVPSPFYKNHFIPLNSLLGLNASVTSATSSSSLISSSSSQSNLLLDHLQQVYLILNDQSDSNELMLLNQNRTICNDVKLLNKQVAYTEDNQPYKILIVDKELKYKVSYKLVDFKYDDNDEDDRDFKYTELKSPQSKKSISKFYTPKATTTLNFSLNDVKTFGQSIDFLQEMVCLTNEEYYESATDYILRKSMRLTKRHVGEDLLNDLELFRKTYIIIYTHLNECSIKLKKLHNKYVRKFLKSLTINDQTLSNLGANLDLIIALACENAINGHLYAKIWPSVLEFNRRLDEETYEKCVHLANYFSFSSDSDNGSEFEFDIVKVSEFYQIDKRYLNLNFNSISNEIKRVALLNNPFEKLECIKTCTDLLSNELTISSVKCNDSQKNENLVINTDTLMPLMAFLLVKSNINCLTSIIYYIELFHFSFQPSKHSTSHNSTYLAELAFLFTTFRAAVQLIQSFNF
jgi:hypothetical protein